MYRSRPVLDLHERCDGIGHAGWVPRDLPRNTGDGLMCLAFPYRVLVRLQHTQPEEVMHRRRRCRRLGAVLDISGVYSISKRCTHRPILHSHQDMLVGRTGKVSLILVIPEQLVLPHLQVSGKHHIFFVASRLVKVDERCYQPLSPEPTSTSPTCNQTRIVVRLSYRTLTFPPTSIQRLARLVPHVLFDEAHGTFGRSQRVLYLGIVFRVQKTSDPREAGYLLSV
jgi:hypothetical protein